MPRVLTLDLSSHTGWCSDGRLSSDAPRFGTWELAVQGEEYEEGLSMLRTLVVRAIGEAKPDIVAWEKPSDPRWNIDPRTERYQTSLTTFLLLTGLAAIAGEAAWSSGVRDLRTVPWRSWFSSFNNGCRLQDGDDPKLPTLTRCKQLGWRVTDDNQADACGIWGFVKATVDPKFSYPVGDTPLWKASR